jgi:acetyltransferase-like isoleucine patch superfamily enzyme
MRLFVRILRLPAKIMVLALEALPCFRFVRETRHTQTPATLGDWSRQYLFKLNPGPYWPVHPTSRVCGWTNILAGIETSPGLMPGCYIQGIGKIVIGDYTQIAPNVGIISANHDLHDNRKHVEAEVAIGKYCWIGMGAVILPGVVLGDYTIVGANAVVTKSFPDGYCVIGGSPAKLIKTLDPQRCVFHKSAFEYHGFIPASEFDEFRRKHLNL